MRLRFAPLVALPEKKFLASDLNPGSATVAICDSSRYLSSLHGYGIVLTPKLSKELLISLQSAYDLKPANVENQTSEQRMGHRQSIFFQFVTS